MAEMGGKCLVARAKLAKYVADLRTASLGERASSLARAMMLSNPFGLAKDVAENTAMLGMDHLASRNVAAGADYLLSLGQSIWSKGEHAPAEFRRIARIPLGEGARTAAHGMSEGWKMALDYLKTGIDPREVADKLDYKSTTFNNKVNNAMVQTVFRLRGLPDYPFSEAATKLSLYGQARLRAIREGLTGPALATRADEILKTDITPEMWAHALEDGMKATFRQPTTVGDYLAGTKRLGPRIAEHATTRVGKLGGEAARLVTDLTIPFTRTVSAALSTGLEYSPVGVIKALIEGVNDKGLMILGRSATGSALLALAYLKARAGGATGPAPHSASERAQWELEGKQPWSIKVGDRWVDYTRGLGPAMVPIAMGIAAGTSDPNEGIGEQSVRALMRAGRVMTEQTGAKNIGRALDAATSDDPEQLQRLAGGYIPVPSLIGLAATTTDPIQRQTQGNTLDYIQSRTPGLSQRLPPRLTQFGDTAHRREGFLSSAIARNHRDSSTPLTNEMGRLGVRINILGRHGTLNGKPFTRTPEQYNALLSEFGPIKRTYLESIIRSDDYQNATDDERRDMLEDALREVQRAANQTDKDRRSGQQVPQARGSDFLY